MRHATWAIKRPSIRNCSVLFAFGCPKTANPNAHLGVFTQRKLHDGEQSQDGKAAAQSGQITRQSELS
jgi:hypothetical protein